MKKIVVSGRAPKIFDNSNCGGYLSGCIIVFMMLAISYEVAMDTSLELLPLGNGFLWIYSMPSSC
jgi:hypothetical protein